jgi:hypothetical protein
VFGDGGARHTGTHHFFTANSRHAKLSAGLFRTGAEVRVKCRTYIGDAAVQALIKQATFIRNAAMDAITLLKQDHANVKAMFQQYEELGERAFANKKKLADKICLELTKHATAEEEIFYPAVREASEESEDQVDEATVEHASAKDLIGQLAHMDPHDDLYDAKVKVLGEYIAHHVKEEEGEMFPSAKKAGLDLNALGDQIAARKEEIEFVPPVPTIPPNGDARLGARGTRGVP